MGIPLRKCLMVDCDIETTAICGICQDCMRLTITNVKEDPEYLATKSKQRPKAFKRIWDARWYETGNSLIPWNERNQNGVKQPKRTEKKKRKQRKPKSKSTESFPERLQRVFREEREKVSK